MRKPTTPDAPGPRESPTENERVRDSPKREAAPKPRNRPTGRSAARYSGPREVAPRVSGPRWAAWAVGPDGERLQAEGESPHDALNTLALRLRDLEA